MPLDQVILIIADAALELVPVSIAGHPAVRKSVKGKFTPSQVLLNSSLHHSAMKGLENAERRGRPDIVHLTLLEALGSPLNHRGLLATYVHTCTDWCIWVNALTRLPRQSDRFNGLLNQLFIHGKLARPEGMDEPLLKLETRTTIADIIARHCPERVLAFSSEGIPKRPTQLFSEILGGVDGSGPRSIAIVIGGFPYGSFSSGTMASIQETFSIFPEPLEAWIVTARILASIEAHLGLI